MNKKKVLKIILIIIAIAFIVFLIHTVRNYIIITDLQNKISDYAKSTNYNIKMTTIENNGTIMRLDTYKKDNKKVVFLERESNGEKTKISSYDTGESHHTYTEAKGEKKANLNGGFITVQIYNGTEMDNTWQTILCSITANIKSVKENGKEYYQLRNIVSSSAITFEGETYLVDKATGLLYKNTNSISTYTREYEFNNVDEPDISEYQLQEN